jgi:hypothetical protein
LRPFAKRTSACGLESSTSFLGDTALARHGAPSIAKTCANSSQHAKEFDYLRDDPRIAHHVNIDTVVESSPSFAGFCKAIADP